MKKLMIVTVCLGLLATMLAAENIDVSTVPPGGQLQVGKTIRFTLNGGPVNRPGVTATWDLGDHSPTVQGTSVDHVYKDPGTYQVQCTLSSGGSPTTTQIQILDNRSIQVQPSSPTTGQTVQFQAQDFGQNQIRWDFGDGTIQNAGTSVTHAFSNPGSITVKAYDFNGQSTTPVQATFRVLADMRTLLMSGGPAKANFPVQVVAGHFASPSLRWDWDDGTVETGGATMQHVYARPGNYTVSVQVVGADAATAKTLALNVAADPRQVNASPVTPGLYEDVAFRADHFPGGSLEWNFGDGNTQTGGQQVSHAYDRLGQFQVTVKTAGSAEPPVSIQVRVNQDRRRILLQPGQASVGDRVQLKLQNVSAATVEWVVGGVTLPEHTPAVSHRFVDPGNVEINCRIPDQSPLTARINVRETRRINYSPGTVFVGAKVQFMLLNGMGPGVRWEFSDGVTRNEGVRLEREFSRSGHVEVSAFDSNGQAAVPVRGRIQVLDDNRSIETAYARHFAGTEVKFEARRFRDAMVDWDFGDGSRRTGPTRISHTFRAPGTYRVQAVDFRGRDGKSQVLSIQVVPDQRSLKAPGRIREGEPVMLEMAGMPEARLEWNLGMAGRQSGMAARNVIFPRPGRVTVTVTDNSGTYPPFSGEIQIVPDDRTLEAPRYALPGQKIQLTAKGFDGPKVAWNYGDGTPPVQGGVQSSHSFEKVGRYRITARDGGGSGAKEFDRTVQVVELVPGFTLQRMELAFASGKAYSVIPRKSRPPRYSLRLMGSGRGVLRGRWKLDDQVLSLFSLLVQDGRVTSPHARDLPVLPVLDVGMHVLTVEFVNYRFGGRIPHLRYFVSSGGAIALVAPLPGEKIQPTDRVTLKWKTVRSATHYEIAVSEVPFQFLSDQRIEWRATDETNRHFVDMSRFSKARWLYWIVRGLNDSGRVLTTSEVGSFREAGSGGEDQPED